MGRNTLQLSAQLILFHRESLPCMTLPTFSNLFTCQQLFMIIFMLLRRKAWAKKVNELSRTRRGWLHFIYGDRKSAMRPSFKTRHNEHHNHDLAAQHLLLPPHARDDTQRDESKQVNGKKKTDQPNGSLPAESQDKTSDPKSMRKGSEEASRYRPLSDDIEGRNDSIEDLPSEGDVRPVIGRSMSIDSVTQMGRRLLDVISIQDSDIQKVKGIDAVQYLMFQRYILYFLTLLTAICMIIILPLNLQGTMHDDSKPYARTTISNISGSSNLLWSHSIISILLMPIGIALMTHFSRSIKAENEQVARRTLFIRRIPKNKTNKEVLVNFLKQKFSDVVIEGVQLVYDIKKLRDLYTEHINTVNAIYYCQEYLDEFKEPCEIRPYFLGHFGGLCCCCRCCAKTDGLLYYREQEAQIERSLEKHFRETISNPIGSVFITFKTEKMAQSVYKYLKQQQEEPCSCLPCTRVWHCIRNMCAARDEMKLRRWQVSYAPNPEDVNWDDISDDTWKVWVRRIVVNFFLFIIFFFLTTPPILINTLNYLRLLDPISTRLNEISPLLTEYFSPLLLVLAALILPVLITFASTFLPYKTMSEKNHSTMWKVYLFLLLMVLILPSLGLTSAKAMIETFASEQKFRWKCLFPVDNGAFFINYVLQSALLGNAFELLRFPELIIYFYYTLVFTKSAAEYENARQQILFDFSFGVRYPRFLLIFAMVVSYSLSCPLIAPCGLLYMGLKHLVDKYNIYYVYTPSKINDQIHSTAIMFFHIGILMMQFQVFTFNFLRTGYSDITGLSMVSVIITLIFFSGHCFFHCFRNINHLTYSAASTTRPDSDRKVDKNEFCACLYLPPVLFELNEHGIRAETTTNNQPNNYGAIKASTGQSHPASQAERAPVTSHSRLAATQAALV